MTHATYLPGGALAIVTPRVALLTAADGFDAIDGFWRLAIAGETHVPTILDALAGDGLAAMPAFALRVSSDDAVSLVLRQGYVALVDEPGGARTLDAAGVGDVGRVPHRARCRRATRRRRQHARRRRPAAADRVPVSCGHRRSCSARSRCPAPRQALRARLQRRMRGPGPPSRLPRTPFPAPPQARRRMRSLTRLQ